jgi:hypothetical protein
MPDDGDVSIVATRLLSQGRVHVYTTAHDAYIASVVDADDGIHGVKRSERRWDCSCSNPWPCPHAAAVAVMVRQRDIDLSAERLNITSQNRSKNVARSKPLGGEGPSRNHRRRVTR